MLAQRALGTEAPVQLRTLRWDHTNAVVYMPEHVWPQGRQNTAGQRSTTWWGSAAASGGTIRACQRYTKSTPGANSATPGFQLGVYCPHVPVQRSDCFVGFVAVRRVARIWPACIGGIEGGQRTSRRRLGRSTVHRGE